VGRWVTDQPLAPDSLIRELDDPASGALVLFYGVVRNVNDDRPVASMTYEAHERLAEQVLSGIEREVVARFGVRGCRIQHRVGHLALGEASVIIVVSAGHREEAYAASRYAIDEVKRRAPIWKEEHYVTGESRYLDGVPLVPAPEE